VETTLREQQTQLTNNVNTQIRDLTNLINANQTNLETRLGQEETNITNRLNPQWTNWTSLGTQFFIFLLLFGKVLWDEWQKRILRQDLESFREHLRRELKK
jgi:hypothetical protein